MKSSLRIAVFTALLAGSQVPAFAQWTTDPAGGIPLCPADGTFTPCSVSDGAGGAITVWEDRRSGWGDIYAQRISASGHVLWNPSGVAICTAYLYQMAPKVVSDGAGGAIITWNDQRSGVRLYAQRIDRNGVLGWAADGVEICTVADANPGYPQIDGDGAGGAIITWSDYRNGFGSVYAQRINDLGAVQWPANGVVICTGTTFNGDIRPTIVGDGAEGAIITWNDNRVDGGNSCDIYAQRIGALGVVGWAVNGVAICTAANSQTIPAIVGDGVGGAIITWQDGRVHPMTPDIYARRINASGVVQWTADGVAICSAGGGQYEPKIIGDGIGGAIVAWGDRRNGYTIAMLAQRVSASGFVQWTADGVRVCIEDAWTGSLAIVGDGAAGAIIAWTRYIPPYTNDGDIYAQHLSASGVAQWAVTQGVAICTAPNMQNATTIVDDGAGGAVIAWSDSRSGTSIYAQRVQANGQLGGYVASVPEAAGVSLVNFPNPFNPRTTIRFELPRAGSVQLAVFDVAGRLVRVLVETELDQGAHDTDWDGRDASGRKVGSGSYLARLRSGGKVETVRMALVQ